MPFYLASDLFDMLEHGKVDLNIARRYITQVAQAVEHLHTRNIVHNDIKLENIFIDEGGQAILGDPGLALMLEGGWKTSSARRVGGTREYWPPERVMAARHDQLDPFKVKL
ncbi:serine/threonine-protein kinase Nek7 [Elysia marginata]|uniref:Serine/threonine-protein kinase Nek7 n=1 Tax=Elysia marginata TaxID=1093978 RepID=A0AAV4I3L2_9GAST|nr:serine/threonine-protein kinase Nek7 [Elysia marginata]